MSQTPRGRLSRSSSFSNDSVSTEIKISLREEIALRKDKEKKDKEENITFKPRIYTSKYSSKDGSTPSRESDKSFTTSTSHTLEKENRFDKLYADALKRHINSQYRPEENKELTFTPRLTQKGSRSRSSSRTRDGTSEGGDTDSIYSRSRSRSSSRSRAPEIDIDCTFKPQITKRGRSVDRGADKSQFSHRLFEESSLIKEKMEKRLEESILRELENCTFKPTLSRSLSSSRSASRSNTPSKQSENVDIRLHKDNEERKKRLEETIKRHEEEILSSTPFKPILSTNSFKNSIKEKEPESKLKIFDRLSIPFQRNYDLPPDEKEQLTFQPMINSKRAPSPSIKKNDDRAFSSVHERLFVTGIEKVKEIEIERQQLLSEKDNQYTFSPSINSSVKIKYEGPDKVNVFKRLTSPDQKDCLKERLERLRQELSKDETFSPVISEQSKYISHRKDDLSLFDRLVAEDTRVKTYITRQQEEKINKELEDVTFTPTIPVKSKDLIKKMGYKSNINASTVSFSNSMSDILPGNDYQNNFVSSKTIGFRNESDTNLILSEKELQQTFDRLSTVKQEKSNTSSNSKIPTKTVSAKNIDDIISRLNSKYTKSLEPSHLSTNQNVVVNKPIHVHKVNSVPKVYQNFSSKISIPTPPLAEPTVVKVIPRKKKEQVSDEVSEKEIIKTSNEPKEVSNTETEHKIDSKPSHVQSPKKFTQSPKKEVTILPLSNASNLKSSPNSSFSNTKDSAPKPIIFKSNFSKPKLDFSLEMPVQEPIVEFNGNVQTLLSESESETESLKAMLIENELSIEEEFNTMDNYMSGESSDDHEIIINHTSKFMSSFGLSSSKVSDERVERVADTEKNNLRSQTPPPKYFDLPTYNQIESLNKGDNTFQKVECETSEINNIEKQNVTDILEEHRVDQVGTIESIDNLNEKNLDEIQYGNEFENENEYAEVNSNINSISNIYSLSSRNQEDNDYSIDDNNDNAYLLDPSTFTKSKSSGFQQQEEQKPPSFNYKSAESIVVPDFSIFSGSNSSGSAVDDIELKIQQSMKMLDPNFLKMLNPNN